MTALQEAANLYAKHDLRLSDDITYYMKYGYVFNTPEKLLLARAIDLERGIDVWLNDQRGGDCWYVKLAVGKDSIPWFLSQIPFPKPYVAWGRDFLDRKSKLHIYSLEKLLKKFNKLPQEIAH